MTAEIALLNRSALALAADSAVTLRIGSSYKTYNTAEKIFEFSCRQPIAIMIYNNVEFVGIPFDVLIRKHRDECSIRHKTLRETADHFIGYLSSLERKNDEDKQYLVTVLIDELVHIKSEMAEINRKRMAGDKVGPYNVELAKCIEKSITYYQSAIMADYLADKVQEDFDRDYGDVITQAIDINFKRPDLIDEDNRKRVSKLCFVMIRSEYTSEICTGIVFGGFGDADLFPTLHYFEIDGIYFNQIKVVGREEVDIDRGGNYAQVVPFAQKEMAERFVYGVDEDFSYDVIQHVSSIFSSLVNKKKAAFSAKEVVDLEKAIKENISDVIRKFRFNERQSILDIVNFMSKKELAEMAASLVEVTSAKRRFSSQQETVGGPIDVAIISRSEGFVWIRRKHYFEREANPAYFSRVFPRKGGR